MRSLFVGITALLASLACNDPKDMLKDQRNARVTFYGLAVDETGRPLKGVTVSYRVEAIPSDWKFDTRGQPHVVTFVRATSDAQGRFDFTVDAHIIKREHVTVPAGYRHLFEEFQGTRPGEVIPSTYGYLVTSWGDLCYKSDPDRPAIFVFVRDGVKEVSALPSRGGHEASGQDWIPNRSAWPKKPSLKDVVYVPPATQPSTQPATRPAE